MDRDTYLQLGIHGIAEDKEFHQERGLPVRRIRRLQLAEFIRGKCALSGREFAKSVGVSPATISKWLYTDTMPSIRIAKRIATIYGITVAEVDKLFDTATG